MFTANYGILTSFKMNPRHYPKSIVWVPATDSINNLLLTHAEFVGFFGHLKNLPHAFLRRVSERICPHVPVLRHVKEPSTYVNYDVLAKFLVYFPPSLAEVSRVYVVRDASGDGWGEHIEGKGTIGLKAAVPKRPHTRPFYCWNIITFHQQTKVLRRRSAELRVLRGGKAETATNIQEYQFNVDFRGIGSEEVTSQRSCDELPFCVAGGGCWRGAWYCGVSAPATEEGRMC
jgi:hypothetical protein